MTVAPAATEGAPETVRYSLRELVLYFLRPGHGLGDLVAQRLAPPRSKPVHGDFKRPLRRPQFLGQLAIWHPLDVCPQILLELLE